MEEVKNIAARSVNKMNENLSETQKLLESSEEVSLMAKDFEKNSIELENVMKAQSFWMCSKWCIIMFAGIGLLILIIILIIVLHN